jgi:hypothetical protein
MTTTFVDYAAAAEAKKSIAEEVLGHTYALCEALRQNFIDYSIKSHQHAIKNNGIVDKSYVPYHQECIKNLKQGISDYEFTIETGRKYHKIVMNANGSKSVHAFVDRKTGGLYKSASWKAPAKGERYNLMNDEHREWLLENATWSSGYLYAK